MKNRVIHILSLAMPCVVLLSTGIAFAADNLKWDKTFPQSDKVSHRKVSYSNRLGINLVGDLYVPKNLDRSKRSPPSWSDRHSVA